MTTPEHEKWDNWEDDTDSFASGDFEVNKEPAVTIPELIDRHKVALGSAATIVLGILAGGVAANKYRKRQKGKQE